MDLLSHNREAWNLLSAQKNEWTVPATPQQIAQAKAGKISIVLTPTKPIPAPWLGNLSGKKVLCLASGGGQQAPLLAAAGAQVTVLDNSPAQLATDQQVAQREGLEITTIQGDMRHFPQISSNQFHLIIHPVSNCFIDDVRPLWKEAYRVLQPGGELLAGFSNPAIYLFEPDLWDNEQRLVVTGRIPYSDLEQRSPERLVQMKAQKEALEFGHTLEDQIAGQIDCGFSITGFYEDLSNDPLIDAHIPMFIATRARKPQSSPS
ncbi:MAG: class I SAM-dependent methyltransferase [Spirochaetales bacterium]|nr:class I SAM-dependent methyltransferase [Spirochaetales bacterium]